MDDVRASIDRLRVARSREAQARQRAEAETLRLSTEEAAAEAELAATQSALAEEELRGVGTPRALALGLAASAPPLPGRFRRRSAATR